MTEQPYTDTIPDDVEVDPTAYRVEAPGRTTRLASTRTAPIGQSVMFEALEQEARDASPLLTDRFLVPPFSVLDTRQGHWQKRKQEWLALGIQSEIGRGDLLLYANQERLNEIKNDTSRRGADQRSNLTGQAPSDLAEANGMTYMASGTSIFDPTLCEAVYTWFAPRDGSVLDPFAGGSVRGITAALTAHPYTGIDLSVAQVQANRGQAASILGAPGLVHHPDELTPVVQVWIDDNVAVYLKRDDLFGVAGVQGGKVRTCWALAQGSEGPLVTASSRHSPQAVIVAAIAQRLGRACHLVMPSGPATPEIERATALGAIIEVVKPGYNNVLIARAREMAVEVAGTYIPFGMEHEVAVEATSRQVLNIPPEADRIVVPVGSGMSLAGVLRGLETLGRDVPVLGVYVGADPTQRLDKYAPGWRERQVTLVQSPYPYDTALVASLGGVVLDSHYEAKCVEHLRENDLLWVVGVRQSQQPSSLYPVPHWYVGDSARIEYLLPPGEQYDLVFTCPPYYDLEVYSDDPADLSTADTYEAFLALYTRILGLSAKRLRDERFYVVVVGEIRDKAGWQRGLVHDTISICTAAGLHLYNEAVLYTPAGTLQLRVPKQFIAGRKMGRTHQSVLVFWKGDKPPRWGEG